VCAAGVKILLPASLREALGLIRGEGGAAGGGTGGGAGGQRQG